MNPQPVVSISIVSHGQGALVAALLPDIAAYCALPVEVILTLNVPEILSFDVASCPFPVKVVHNPSPKGFGANHNSAFALAGAGYFCVLNPDIRAGHDVWSPLVELLKDKSIGAAGPLIVNPEGGVEDSARKFPTPAGIVKKAMFGSSGPDYPVTEALIFPDWIAGMFMMFRSEVFRTISGFDEGYFLYYEDADLCWRLRVRQLRTAVFPAVRATHDARRSSHGNPRYLWWHINSMLRFFNRRARA